MGGIGQCDWSIKLRDIITVIVTQECRISRDIKVSLLSIEPTGLQDYTEGLTMAILDFHESLVMNNHNCERGMHDGHHGIVLH